MSTVRDLKSQVQREAGCVGLDPNFPDLSDGHHAFWGKLNKLGGRGLDVPPESQDIDSKVELSDDEYASLLAEFRSLKVDPRQLHG